LTLDLACRRQILHCTNGPIILHEPKRVGANVIMKSLSACVSRYSTMHVTTQKNHYGYWSEGFMRGCSVAMVYMVLFRVRNRGWIWHRHNSGANLKTWMLQAISAPSDRHFRNIRSMDMRFNASWCRQISYYKTDNALYDWSHRSELVFEKPGAAGSNHEEQLLYDASNTRFK
jgi:hypothetical protein